LNSIGKRRDEKRTLQQPGKGLKQMIPAKVKIEYLGGNRETAEWNQLHAGGGDSPEEKESRDMGASGLKKNITGWMMTAGTYQAA